ncbi:sulfatase [bacterium]|nr:sulfatase [bacterium]
MRSLLIIIGMIACAQQAVSQTNKPNVVLIVSDDQGWGDYSFMAHKQIKTPHLDKLASQSLVYKRGYVPSSLCCPSLASILTGKYPHESKITGNEPPVPKGKPMVQRYKDPEFLAQVNRITSFMANSPRLPAELGKAGYNSFQTGKWWQGNFKTGGFTHGMSHGDQTLGGRHGDEGLNIGRKGLQPIFDFIENSKDKPFFLWYAPMLPHSPHNPPEKYLAKYKDKTPSIHLARYWAMCEWFDETCGELLGHLDKKGLAENTLVVYVTDNGWIQQEGNPQYRLDSKQSPYDGGLRTPIMIRHPGKIKPQMIDTPVSSIDIAPTIYKFCGLPVPEGLKGIDLLDANAVKMRDAVVGACFLHNAIDIEKPEKNLTWRWCVSDDWKLIVPNAANAKGGIKTPGEAKIELYKIGSDPHEEKNLAEANPDVVKSLSMKLDAWWKP